MKRIVSITFIVFYLGITFAQNQIKNDTLDSKNIVVFNKVEASLPEFSTAQLKYSYIPTSDLVVLNFDVPFFIERLNTTVADFCIITTKNKKVKFLNQVAKERIGRSLFYNFTFVVSKKDFTAILLDDVKKITFNFSPNYEPIKNYYEKDKFMEKSFQRFLIRQGKKNITIKVSKPNQLQYEELLFWLQKL